MANRSAHFPFRSEASQELFMRLYDEGIAPLGDACTHRDVPTTAGRTHVLAFGPEGGEPLFLVHGASASASVLRNEIMIYARAGFRVYAPDIPGHAGRSEAKPLSYKDDTLGRWLAEVTAAMSVERAAVIGYSLGGLVDLRLGVHAPERITRAVLAVPGGLSRQTFGRMLPMFFDLVRYRITKNQKSRRKLALA